MASTRFRRRLPSALALDAFVFARDLRAVVPDLKSRQSTKERIYDGIGLKAGL